MDRRKQKLLLVLGYEAISDTIYRKGSVMEVISDQESIEDMISRLENRHHINITMVSDSRIDLEDRSGLIMNMLSAWRSSLPILRSYHTDPKFTAFFGILDVLSTIPKKDMVEDEKPAE